MECTSKRCKFYHFRNVKPKDHTDGREVKETTRKSVPIVGQRRVTCLNLLQSVIGPNYFLIFLVRDPYSLSLQLFPPSSAVLISLYLSVSLLSLSLSPSLSLLSHISIYWFHNWRTVPQLKFVCFVLLGATRGVLVIVGEHNRRLLLSKKK